MARFEPYLSIHWTDPERHIWRWAIPFFIHSMYLLLAIFVAVPSIGVDGHIFHPAVDPLSSEAPPAPHLGGRYSSSLSKSIYQILAQLKIFGDLLESHPSVLHSGTH